MILEGSCRSKEERCGDWRLVSRTARDYIRIWCVAMFFGRYSSVELRQEFGGLRVVILDLGCVWFCCIRYVVSSFIVADIDNWLGAR